MFVIHKDTQFIKQHPQLIPDIKQVLNQLELNPFDLTLKTHKLTGKLNGKYSCSINYEYRIVMIIEIKDNELYLLNIGTHDVVYK